MMLEPKSESGARGAGRFAAAVGERAEDYAYYIFGDIEKIETDPQKKVHTPDFISKKRDFLIEVKSGTALPKGNEDITKKTDAKIHPDIGIIVSKMDNKKRLLCKLLSGALNHAKSKRDGYERVKAIYGILPERSYAFMPMEYCTYASIHLDNIPEILENLNFSDYGVDALVIYTIPISYLDCESEGCGGGCYVYYQEGSHMIKSDIIQPDATFIKVGKHKNNDEGKCERSETADGHEGSAE